MTSQGTDINEKDRIYANKVKFPQSFEGAMKIAKSLAYWIAFIDKNPDNWDDPVESMGGHIEHHLVTLNAWWQTEKLKACCNDLEKAIDDF